MKRFLENDFLLDNRIAEELYRNAASELPIVDYHNHLDPVSLAIDHQCENIADLWVTSDPYKHRAMRINGIPEHFISGDASPKEKYLQWAKTLPKTIGNPLFHWSCAELKYVFGINEVLNESNAESIWDRCNRQIAEQSLSVRHILKLWKTETICTSDDLMDNLSQHIKASQYDDGLNVLPSLRGDSMIAFGSPAYAVWQEKLSEHYGNVNNLYDYLDAIVCRLNIFNETGCRLADHSLDAGFVFMLPAEREADRIFEKRINGQSLCLDELQALQSYLLVLLGVEYAKRGWTLQLHIGAQRFTSSRLRASAGAAGGYACIGSTCDVNGLCGFLDALEQKNGLPNIILYTLNPADNAVMASLTGSFTADHTAGKIQFGPAWWFNDNLDGIHQQLTVLSGYGLLSRFVGMTTDSRSVLSFSRHDYFRRILCNMIGGWVENGLVPNDRPLLEQVISDISYHNAEKMILNN